MVMDDTTRPEWFTGVGMDRDDDEVTITLTVGEARSLMTTIGVAATNQDLTDEARTVASALAAKIVAQVGPDRLTDPLGNDR